MYVERSDERRSLSAVVVKRQQLEASIVLRAEVTLNLIFIAERLKLTAGHEELLGLLFHTVEAQEVAEYLEIAGFIDSRILWNLPEVGEGAPLPLLMGYDRTVIGNAVLIVTWESYLVKIVVIGMWGVLVPVEASCPTLHMIFRAIVPGPSSTYGCAAIELRRVVALHLLHPVVAVCHPVAGRLVAGSHHHKRRMVAISVYDSLRLLKQILVNLLSSTESHAVVRPRRALWLEIEAKFVGGSKGSLRRTIGVEAHVVQAVLLQLGEDAHPRRLVGGRITRLWETTILHRTTKP